jgi:esterase/lipase superfamily enzyme
MRRNRLRLGKVAIKLLIAGSTAAAGGVATMSTMMRDGEKSAVKSPMVAMESGRGPSIESDRSILGSPALPSLPANDLISEESASAEPSNSFAIEVGPLEAVGGSVSEPSEALPPSPVVRDAPKPALKRLAKKPDKVRVFYATDRRLCSAADPHLWITTLAPAFLVVAITLILIAGMFAGRRRVWWSLGAFAGCLLSFIIVGNTIVKGKTLVRLAYDDGLWFSSGRIADGEGYPLNLGSSLVSIPPNHRDGAIERPSVFKLEFSEREDRHVMIQKIEALDPDLFFSQLDQRLSEDDERSALIFIHGYNVKFDDALRRTAQLTFDLGFSGAPILYSWPSHGQLAWYRSDGENAAWSAEHLQQFLLDLRNRTGVKRLHIVAHSMGNRTLVAGLELLGLRHPRRQPMLDQVVMAAPDVDLEEFQIRYADDVEKCALRATVYASSTDRALLASKHLNRSGRLGLTMNSRAVVAGVDFVDVTPIDTSLLGHSYYGSHPLMIQELSSLLGKNDGPQSRTWLTQKDALLAPPVWRFLPDVIGEKTAGLLNAGSVSR